jgi:hypothetical protein
MPTLNPEFNVLVAQGTHDPACEECCADLASREVHDTGVSWVCSECFKASEDYEPFACYREDFHSDG